MLPGFVGQFFPDKYRQRMRIILNKLSHCDRIQNVVGTQQKMYLLIIHHVFQQLRKVHRGIGFPAVKQIQAQVKAEFLLGFYVIVFRLTEEQAGEGATVFVAALVLAPEVFPATLQVIVVNDFFRGLQPVLEFPLLFALGTLLQLTGWNFFFRKTSVVLNGG